MTTVVQGEVDGCTQGGWVDRSCQEGCTGPCSRVYRARLQGQSQSTLQDQSQSTLQDQSEASLQDQSEASLQDQSEASLQDQ